MIRFVPFEKNGVIGMDAFENDVNIGSCTFVINGFDMKFLTVDCNDDIIVEGLARASMNYAANRYAYIAKIDKELSSIAFIRLGFSGDEVLSVEIPVALTSGCSCGH